MKENSDYEKSCFNHFNFNYSLSNQRKRGFFCTSKSSKKYHLKKDCSGIKKCKSKIKKITKKKAENVGRTLCKLEKKKT